MRNGAPLDRGAPLGSCYAAVNQNSKSCTNRTDSAVTEPRPNAAAPTAVPVPARMLAPEPTAAKIFRVYVPWPTLGKMKLNVLALAVCRMKSMVEVKSHVPATPMTRTVQAVMSCVSV